MNIRELLHSSTREELENIKGTESNSTSRDDTSTMSNVKRTPHTFDRFEDEELTTSEIESLMGMYRPRYTKVGGRYRQR